MAVARRRGTVAAAIGVGLAVASTLWLVLQPCAYVGVTVTGSGSNSQEERFCSSLIDVNGWGVLGLFLVPVSLSVGGFMAARGRIRGLVWGTTAVLLAFCVMGALSVGWFYLPSVVALVVAAVRMESPSSMKRSVETSD